MWQLVPPRTFAADRLVVTALLEPWDQPTATRSEAVGQVKDFQETDDVLRRGLHGLPITTFPGCAGSRGSHWSLAMDRVSGH
jgi:hypothetical protein